jgi:O-antigen ligase
LGRPGTWKRALNRFALIAIPVLALYVAMGWEQASSVFAPVQVLRSLTDSTLDSSTRWRDVENWNLAMSIREHPILGLGLGHEYTEFIRGDDISSVFADFKGWPHNSVLGLILFAGPVGFTAMWSLFGCVVFLAVRSYRMARVPDDRTVAMSCIATVIVSAVLAFGDTGAHHAQYRVLVSLALAISGKLAVVTGAWPSARGRRPDSVPASTRATVDRGARGPGRPPLA